MSHIDQSDTLERAMAAYLRFAGSTDSPPPAGVHAYATSHQGRDYVVVGTARRILAIYRVLPRGALRLLGQCPRVLRDLHRARSTPRTA